MGPELGGGRAARSPPGSWQWADTEQKVADLGGHSLLSFCSTGDELLSGTSTVVILECPFISKCEQETKCVLVKLNQEDFRFEEVRQTIRSKRSETLDL
ncbi:uncharacterized protein PS065_017406 isoform 2-T9 [Dugong dugon]